MKFDWMKENQCLVDACSTVDWSHPRVMAYTVTHAKRLTLQAVKYNKMIHIKTKHLGFDAQMEILKWMKKTCHKETVKLIEDWKI